VDPGAEKGTTGALRRWARQRAAGARTVRRALRLRLHPLRVRPVRRPATKPPVAVAGLPLAELPSAMPPPAAASPVAPEPRRAALVLLNRQASAAHDRDLRPAALARRLAAAGFAAEVEAVPGDELAAAARRAAEAGAPVVVAAGGDGTVGTLAGAVAGTGTALGVLPLGGFNHFARDVGIGDDLDEAAAVLAAGHRRRLDLVELHGAGEGPRPMVNNAILGFYPHAVRRRRRGAGGRVGKALATLSALVPTLRRPPFLDLRLGGGDGGERRAVTPFLFVGNNEYRMNLFAFGARPRLDDGRLFVFLVRSSSRRSLLGLLLLYAISDIKRHRRVEQWSAGELTVEADRPELDVFVDGELHRLTLPLAFRVRPGALTVVAPPPGEER
jgi:diacylglycerol kinase family enzyme